MTRHRGVLMFTLATFTLVVAGCAKKTVATAPPAPPQPAAVAPSTPGPAPVRQATNTPPAAVAPKPDYPDAATRARISDLLAKIEDAYFDYDRSTLRPDAIETMQANARELRDILKDYPKYKLTIEGHCDERGSAEYNLALGQARAESARAFLVNVGIPGEQLGIISYGKERPSCQESTEGCWQKNRRVHIIAAAR